jgi:hypothetical protein
VDPDHKTLLMHRLPFTHATIVLIPDKKCNLYIKEYGNIAESIMALFICPIYFKSPVTDGGGKWFLVLIFALTQQ